MTSRQPDDKVLDHTRQQLSALFDGELGLDEARFLQRRLQHDDDLAASWSRWQLAGDVLRGQGVAPAPSGFASGVAAALAEAPAGTPGAVDAGRGMAPPRRPGFLLPGAALAASVAALAMFMARQAPEPAMPAAPAMEIASAVETVPAAPRPAQPVAPAAPAAPDAALQAAGGVIAVAEVPRRAAERRSRAQQQRAAASRAQRSAATEPVLVAAAGSASAPATAPDAVVERAANPFALEAAAEAITARPWPRALLPGSGNAFTVGYGRLAPVAADPHPFRPRPVALPQPSADAEPGAASPDTEDTD